MNEQERLQAYLDAVHPLVEELRRAGWPAEAHVEANAEGRLVVWVRCDLHDERLPVEAVVDLEEPQAQDAFGVEVDE